MSSFSESFEHFIPPDRKTIQRGIVDGLVVLDSNVLLSAYRFAPTSREQLIGVLELIGDRLWVPHQVGLEFHRNRLKVIADYDAAYREVLDSLAQRQSDMVPDLQKKIRELSNRVALPDEERDDLLKGVTITFSRLNHAVLRLRDGHGVGSPTAPDAILSRIGEILHGKLGEAFSTEESEAERLEALRRIEAKIPPGFRDSDKDEPHGDYFVWCQTLREARRRNASVLVLVTSDTKDDWYLRLKGQVLMARPELALECKESAGATLVLLSARNFLKHAKTYLQAEVSDETIRQAERAQLVDVRREAVAVHAQLQSVERLGMEQLEKLQELHRSLDHLDHTLILARGRHQDLAARYLRVRKSVEDGRFSDAGGRALADEEMTSLQDSISRSMSEVIAAEQKRDSVSGEIARATHDVGAARATEAALRVRLEELLTSI